MKNQSYYSAPTEPLSNICDNTKALSVNCVGYVNNDNRVIMQYKRIRRDFYLIYVTDGEMELELPDKIINLCPGSLLIISPDTEHSYSSKMPAGVKYMWVHFTGYDADNLINSLSLKTNTLLTVKNADAVKRHFDRMIYEFIVKDSYFDITTTSILKEILIAFSRGINITSKEKRLVKSILHIHENFNKKISISQLAKSENLSESHYRVIFTKAFGESPNEYITSRRIEASIEMLNSTDASLEEIAQNAGYNDVFYFSRVFKKKMGTTPGKYRKNK